MVRDRRVTTPVISRASLATGENEGHPLVHNAGDFGGERRDGKNLRTAPSICQQLAEMLSSRSSRENMLKDLTKQDWLSILNIPESKIPEVLVLRGTRNLRRNYIKHQTYFDDILGIGSPNGLFEDVFIGRFKNIHIGYASVYGDAMASEITHLFGLLGTSLVIQTGCCGALKNDILAGDIICASSAYCGEGAAQYYLPQEKNIISSKDVFDATCRDIITDLPVNFHHGPIWTTSALLAEGMSEIQQWSSKGFIAVDMETATTFATAHFFGMKKLSLLFAFDNPYRREHLLLTDQEKQQRRALGEQTMIQLVLTIIENYKASGDAH